MLDSIILLAYWEGYVIKGLKHANNRASIWQVPRDAFY